MTTRKPDYFDSFHCIGGACTDTCCAGWEIEVDEESCSRYLQMKGKTGKRLRKELTVTPEESYFALKDGKCPFLNKDGLCDLILAEGEDILCDICREHPRFYNWYGSQTEVGLGLCCEEAERLMFAESRPAAFVMEVQGDDEADEEEEQFISLMMQAREAAFAIVQNRTVSLNKRLLVLHVFGMELQALLDEEKLEKVPALCRRYVQLPEDVLNNPEQGQDIISAAETARELLAEYALLEALDESWPQLLEEAAKEADTLLLQSSAFIEQYPQCAWEYEHLMVYFLNRYFMESVFDMDVLSKVRFGLAGLTVIRLLEIKNRSRTGVRTDKDRNDIIRRYSKEIEYCPENVAALVDASWTLSALQEEKLNAVLNGVF